MLIIGNAKQAEEREFYIRLAIHERWSKRDLERQLKGGRFAKTVLNPIIVSPAVRELHPEAAQVFRDSYALEFLGLRGEHSEADLHGALRGSRPQPRRHYTSTYSAVIASMKIRFN